MNATLFEAHGATMARAVRGAAREVCEVVAGLAKTLGDFASGSGGKEKEYLVRTGAIHETVERIRKEVPEDNLSAVRRRWSVDKGMMQDSLEDVDGMLEDGEEDEDEDEDEGFGDDEMNGLEELGFTSKKLSKEEVERIKKVCVLISLKTDSLIWFLLVDPTPPPGLRPPPQTHPSRYT